MTDVGRVLVVLPTYDEKLTLEKIVGRTLQSVPEAHVLVAEVAARTSQTLATRFGPAVAWALTALGAAAVLAGAWRRRRAGTLDA